MLRENMTLHWNYPYPIHEHEFICECGHKAIYLVYKTSRTPRLDHIRQVTGKTKGSEFYGKTYFMETIKCKEKGCGCKSPVWKLDDGRIIRWSQDLQCTVIVENGKEHEI